MNNKEYSVFPLQWHGAYIGVSQITYDLLNEARALLEREEGKEFSIESVIHTALRAFDDVRDEKIYKDAIEAFECYVIASIEDKMPHIVSVDFVESTIKDSMKQHLIVTSDQIDEFWHEYLTEAADRLNASIEYTTYHEYHIASYDILEEGSDE